MHSEQHLEEVCVMAKNVDHGLCKESSRSVLPRIDAALLHQSVLQICHEGATYIASSKPTEKMEFRFMPPTAAAGQLQRQQRSPSPPPFRAGFHFERAQTPDLASRQKEQQRLAQHNAFKATQPSCRKKQSCTAAGEDAGQEDWSAHAVASTATNTVSVKTVSDAGSTGYTPGVSGSGQAAAAVTPQASTSNHGATSSSGTSSSGGSGASSSDSGIAAAANVQQPPAQRQAPQTHLQLPKPPSQQQQQQPLPSTVLSSSRGSIGNPLSTRKHTRGSTIGGPGPPHHPNIGSPIICSQGLLHAMAAGYSKQALDSLMTESLAMLPSQAEAADVADLDFIDLYSPTIHGSTSSSPKHRLPAVNRNLALHLARSASSNRMRMATGESAAGLGRATSSRPGSGLARGSGQRGLGLRESDPLIEDFPSLDSPVVQQGFNLGQTAAALGNSITQLRHAEKVQLQQQQQQRQQQGAAKEPQQVQQQKQQRQKPLEQALKTEEQAVLNKQRGASSAKGTAKGSDSSFSSGAAATAGKGAIPAQPSAGRKKRAQIAEDATASAGAAKQGKSAAGGAGPDPPGGAAATAASAGAGKAAAGVGGVKAAPVTSSGMPNPQSPCLVEVKLQVRALAAPAEVLEMHTKSDLLLTQVSGVANSQQPHGTVTTDANSSTSSSSTLAAGGPAAAIQSSAASSSQPNLPMDPMVAQFGGRRSPARDRVLRASWDKQRLWQQQQEQLQPGWRGTAAAAAAAAVCGSVRDGGSTQQQQQQLRRHSPTPEPYLYSNRAGDGWQLGRSGSNGSSSIAPSSQLCSLQKGKAPQQVQQLACTVTQAVNQQATDVAAGPIAAAAAAAAPGEAAASAGASTSPGPGSSALGLKIGEVERLIARYHQQGQDAGMDLYPTTFNLDHALASRQQVQALAAAIPQLPDLRMLLLRNNGLKDKDLQVLSAALLNPGACGICGLDLGFNQLGPEAPLLVLPLLHKPPQALLQARRRSTAEAAGEGEGLGARSQNPSSTGAKTLGRSGSSQGLDLGGSNSQSYSQNGGQEPSAKGSTAGPSKQTGIHTFKQAVQTVLDASAGMGRTGGGSTTRQFDRRSFKPQRQSMLQRQSATYTQMLQQQQQSLYALDHAMLLQLVMCSNMMGDAGAEVICKVIGTGDCLLQLLDLSGCGITERLSGCLQGMLEGARQLKVLRLGWNMLGPKGAKALAEGLKYCSSGLEQLYLPWSGITDTGASHIAKALESNSSVRLLDLSGCQVSAGTCVVLAETLSSNTVLDAVILQDNPLGALGVQKLLKAVHEGHVRHVDIGGCSFLAPPTHQLAGTNGISSSSAPAPRPKSPKLKSAKKGKTQPAAASSAAKAGKSTNSKAKSATGKQKQTDTAQNTGSEGSAGPRGVSATPACALRKIGGQAGCAASAFDVREPDGVYTLDLALPPDRQVAVELLKLTEDHGLDSWVNPTLDKKAFSIAGVTKQSLPSQGTLTVTFIAKHKLSREAQPLNEPEFHSLWTQQVQPHATPSRPSLLLQQQEPQQLLHPGAQWTDAGNSWNGGGGPVAGLEGSLAGSGMRMRAVSDGWKLELLQVLLQDCYFTSAQAGQVVAAFSYGEDKVEAAVKIFGRVIDPENFADQAYLTMNAWQVELADSRIGCLKLFSPDNPTGKYSLLLSHPAQRLVGVRLVELFCQQHIEGLCSYPHSVCFTAASLDDKPLPPGSFEDPLRKRLPKSGILKVCFVDLKPVPPTAKPVTPEGFAVLLSMLTGADKLDGWELAQAVDAADLQTKVSVVGRFETWSTTHGPFTGKVGALRRLKPDAAAVTVRDTAGLLEAIHIFAIHHYLMGSQLQELIKLVPLDATEQRVELCSRFWARLTDRAKTWSDVMRTLTSQQQVLLSHRLGMANVFDPVRPSMHYKLRMWRADEHQIAWRLHRMALNASHNAFVGFAIDGIPKKIAQTDGLWTVMRGSAADNDTPTVTLDFDFVWQDNLLPQWAAVTIQSAWRAYLIRKAAPPPVLRLRFESMSGRPQHAIGVRASIAGGRQQQDAQQLTYRSQQPIQRSYGTQDSTAGRKDVNSRGSSRSVAGKLAQATYRGSVSGMGMGSLYGRESAIGNPYRDSLPGLGSVGSGVGEVAMGKGGRRVGEMPEWDPLLRRSVAEGVQSSAGQH